MLLFSSLEIYCLSDEFVSGLNQVYRPVRLIFFKDELVFYVDEIIHPDFDFTRLFRLRLIRVIVLRLAE